MCTLVKYVCVRLLGSLRAHEVSVCVMSGNHELCISTFSKYLCVHFCRYRQLLHVYKCTCLDAPIHMPSMLCMRAELHANSCVYMHIFACTHIHPANKSKYAMHTCGRTLRTPVCPNLIRTRKQTRCTAVRAQAFAPLHTDAHTILVSLFRV